MNACLFMCLSCHTLKKVPITSNATLVTYQRWKTLMEQTPQPSNSMLLWLTNQIKPPIAAMLEILMVGGNYQMINTLRVVFLACLLLRRLHAEMSSLIRGRVAFIAVGKTKVTVTPPVVTKKQRVDTIPHTTADPAL